MGSSKNREIDEGDALVPVSNLREQKRWFCV